MSDRIGWNPVSSVERRTGDLHHRRAVRSGPVRHDGRQTRLADPGLTPEQHRHGSVGPPRARTSPHSSSSRPRSAARPTTVDPGRGARGSGRSPWTRYGRSGSVTPLTRLASRASSSKTPRERAHLLGHDHRAGIGQPLEPRRDVHRQPVDVVVLGIDVHHPPVNRDAHVERLADLLLGRGGELVHCADDVEAGPDRPLHVVAVRARDPEQREQAVALRTDDVTVVATLDDREALVLVAADQPTVAAPAPGVPTARSNPPGRRT